jgi:hypothetical protein
MVEYLPVGGTGFQPVKNTAKMAVPRCFFGGFLPVRALLSSVGLVTIPFLIMEASDIFSHQKMNF